jgi:hypothetical protein
MVSKCANANCLVTFHYLHEGKLFVVDEDAAGSLFAAPHRALCFWLCSQCSQRLAVTYDAENGMRLIPAPSATLPRTSCEVFPSESKVINRPVMTKQGGQLRDVLSTRISALQ